MINKKITYKDFNGVEHTEEHYFHLNKLERMRIDAKYKGGIANWATQQSESGVAAGLLTAVEDIIATSHGTRTEDGRFVKDPEETKKFVESEAYSEFVASLFEGDDIDAITNNISDFMRGLIETSV